jgi:CheY-like chemotaxis protein
MASLMARAKTKQKVVRKKRRPVRRGKAPVRAKAPVRGKASVRGKPAMPVEADVLAVFAHDIRTSLTGILALGELLASSNLGERERQWASGIKSSAEHLAALTTLVIDAAKVRSGALTLQRDLFRPRWLIETMGETLRARAETKGLEAELSIADNIPPRAVGDAVRLRAALENLIDNAVKFTERGSVRLEATAKPAGRGRVAIALAVTDSGIGLEPAEIKRLFRPFGQASADIARRYGGAGLGLAVVKLIAKLMGGELTLASTPGRGSRFCLTAVLDIAPAYDEAGSNDWRERAPGRPLKILCAEDNPYGRVILNTILSELGHRADFVGSGEEALGRIGDGYDAVLMDITLPGIDGLETTRRIRALGGTGGAIPIVGISGRATAGDEAAARGAGMNAYLRKPISPSALGEALAAMTRS